MARLPVCPWPWAPIGPPLHAFSALRELEGPAVAHFLGPSCGLPSHKANSVAHLHLPSQDSNFVSIRILQKVAKFVFFLSFLFGTTEKMITAFTLGANYSKINDFLIHVLRIHEPSLPYEFGSPVLQTNCALPHVPLPAK